MMLSIVPVKDILNIFHAAYKMTLPLTVNLKVFIEKYSSGWFSVQSVTLFATFYKNVFIVVSKIVLVYSIWFKSLVRTNILSY